MVIEDELHKKMLKYASSAVVAILISVSFAVHLIAIDPGYSVHSLIVDVLTVAISYTAFKV